MEKNTTIYKDWSVVFVDTDAQEHFLVFLYQIYLAVQPSCTEEEVIVQQVYFQH